MGWPRIFYRIVELSSIKRFLKIGRLPLGQMLDGDAGFHGDRIDIELDGFFWIGCPASGYQLQRLFNVPRMGGSDAVRPSLLMSDNQSG
ncbi:MAG: hypothetical protein FJ122_07400 [Deltaproteobacteria bacterium]|nr:hypothetical protein [Deltaproteobacteria bacterium]